MFLLLNILGIFAFLGIGALASRERKMIPWKNVGVLLVCEVILAWFLTTFSVGREGIKIVVEVFSSLLHSAYVGIRFAVPDWVNVPQMNFLTAALLPILFVVPLFDILNYIGVLPFIVRWCGKALAKISHAARFESFFAIEMMFLGNTEAIGVSRVQLKRMKAERNLAIAMMSMSCISVAMLGVYSVMMPADLVLTAVPLNAMSALLAIQLLNPTKVPPEEDIIYEVQEKGKKEPFFSFLSDSILGAGKIVLIIFANVVAFVALEDFFNVLLGTLVAGLSLETIFGYFMLPFAWLLGLQADEAFLVAQYMGEKLVTNEIVVMLSVKDHLSEYSTHAVAVMTLFVTSFANFSTLGMVLGCAKGIMDEESNLLIGRNVWRIFVSGILVSLFTAAIGGMFFW